MLLLFVLSRDVMPARISIARRDTLNPSYFENVSLVKHLRDKKWSFQHIHEMLSYLLWWTMNIEHSVWNRPHFNYQARLKMFSPQKAPRLIFWIWFLARKKDRNFVNDTSFIIRMNHLLNSTKVSSPPPFDAFTIAHIGMGLMFLESQVERGEGELRGVLRLLARKGAL